MIIPEDQRLTIDEINLPDSKAFDIARKSAYESFGVARQWERAKEVVENNLSEDKIRQSGFSVTQLASLLRDDGVADEVRDLYSEKYGQLESKGISIPELRNRFLQGIEEDRAKADNPRIGVAANIGGTLAGYFSDWANLGVNLPSMLRSIVRPGMRIGEKMVRSAIENMAVEGILASNVDGRIEDKIAAVGFAGAIGGALPAVGSGVSKGFKKAKDLFLDRGIPERTAERLVRETREEVSKKVHEIFETSKDKDVVLSALKEETSQMSRGVGREFLEEITERVERLPTRNMDNAYKLLGEIEESIADGTYVPRRFEEKLYVELKPGQRVYGRDFKELKRNLKESLSNSDEFMPGQVDEAVENLENQIFIGEFDTYKVVEESVKRRSTTVTGAKLDVTKRPMVYKTLDEAEKALEKAKIPDAEILEQSNGLFAVVRGSDGAVRMPGTKRFATAEEARQSLKKYADNFGIDEDSLTVEAVPSKGTKASEDYVVTHNMSVKPLSDPDRATNTLLDTMVVKKETVLSEPVERGNIESGTKALKREDTSVYSVEDAEASLDRTLVDDRIKIVDEKSFKKFNGELKKEKELNKILKECM